MNASFCTGAVFNCPIIYVYAKGDVTFTMPDGVALKAEHKYVTLSMHYDNPALVSGAIDNSGVNIRYTKTTPTHEAAFIQLGDPLVTMRFNPPIPVGMAQAHYETECPTQCTSTFDHDITVIATTLHMHAFGSRMWTTLATPENETTILSRAEFYNWEMQTLSKQSTQHQNRHFG